MIRVSDIVEKAQASLQTSVYQKYGDSPTIKSYTDWNVFEEAFSLPATSDGVSGADPVDVIPSFTFNVGESRALSHHFSSIRTFYLGRRSDIVSVAEEGRTAHHILVCSPVSRSLTIRDVASAPKSLTLDVLVRPGVSMELTHIIVGSAPQYTHVRAHLGNGSSLSVRLFVHGKNAHARYDVFLNGDSARFSLSGASVGGRSDVVTNAFLFGDGQSASVRYALFSSTSDFLVHRGVLRVAHSASRAYADMDSSFLTTGGFVASVPELEIFTDDVLHASHRSRDLALSEEQLFYLQSRGLSKGEIMSTYVEGILSEYLGDLRSKEIEDAIRSFAGSLLR